jgi:hypothetical protein
MVALESITAIGIEAERGIREGMERVSVSSRALTRLLMALRTFLTLYRNGDW